MLSHHSVPMRATLDILDPLRISIVAPSRLHSTPDLPSPDANQRKRQSGHRRNILDPTNIPGFTIENGQEDENQY